MNLLKKILNKYTTGNYTLIKLQDVQTSVFINSLFSFYELTIFDMEFSLLVCLKKTGVKDLKYYEEKFYNELKHKVLFYDETPFSSTSKKMMEKKIGFINCQGQIFIPYIFMNIYQNAIEEDVVYRKSTQQIATYYLLHEKKSVKTLQEVKTSASNIN